MRCEMCLQVLKKESIWIVIQKDGTETLVARCNCGKIERLENIAKQKAIG